MAGNLPAIRAVQGTVSGLWKSVGIPTDHVSPQCIATFPEFIADLGTPQTIFRPASWRPCFKIHDNPTPTSPRLFNSLPCYIISYQPLCSEVTGILIQVTRCISSCNSCNFASGLNMIQHSVLIHTLRPRQMAAFFQTTFSNAFSWMKMYQFRLRFHWGLFLLVQLTIFQHWFR